jgi:hypothetical protein
MINTEIGDPPKPKQQAVSPPKAKKSGVGTTTLNLQVNPSKPSTR